MNIFQFIASITNSLVWPIAVILIVFFLRKTLAKLILSLQRLRLNYKDKDLELNFGAEIAALGAEAAQAKLPNISSQTDLLNEQIKVEVQTEESDKLKSSLEEINTNLQELKKESSTKPEWAIETHRADLELQKISLEVEKQRLDIQNILNILKENNSQPLDKNADLVAERGPVGAIIIAWERVQKELLSFVQSVWRGASRPPTVSDAFRMLPSYIDPKTVEILVKMRQLRNELAHADEDKLKITFAEALEYIQLAESVITLISPLNLPLRQENLATMTPEAVEGLIRELFSKIFKEHGGELRIPSSHDKGVDAIVIDPDPIRGGKYVIQVKKYNKNNPVPAPVVRDFLGAIDLENAIKGFLITTSSFTQEALHFAVSQKSLVLIDGTQLLHLFKKYGYNVTIEWPNKESHT